MKFLLALTIISLLSNTSFSQWWVDGGNLIWPYGDVNVTNGSVISSEYEHIIFEFNKNGDENTFTANVYRNDTGTTIDSIYWTGGTYGSSYLIQFSGAVVSGAGQTIIPIMNINYCWSDSAAAFVYLTATRSGLDSRVLLKFIEPDGNALDLFSADAIIDLIIIPDVTIDSYSKTW